MKPLKKLIIIVGISALTLGVLFGAYFFYTHFFIQEPLSTTLDNSELIGKYQMDNNHKKPVLKLKLNKVDDLAGEFQHFLANSGQLLTEKDLQVELFSNPNAKLLHFYQEINPTLYEVLSLNNFSSLQKELEMKNQQYGLTNIKLIISIDYLFLQLEDNENYLYYILNRDKNSYPEIINNIGSDME